MKIEWAGYPRLIYDDTRRLGFPGQVFFYEDYIYWAMDDRTNVWKVQKRRDHDL